MFSESDETDSKRRVVTTFLSWVYTRDLVVTISFVLGVAATNREESVETDSKRRVATTFYSVQAVVATDSYCLHVRFLSRQSLATKSSRPIRVKNRTCKPSFTRLMRQIFIVYTCDFCRDDSATRSPRPICVKNCSCKPNFKLH